MIRRYFLSFDSIKTDSGVSVAALEDARNRSKGILEAIGIVIDLLTVYHMFLAGMAVCYMVVLLNPIDDDSWITYFIQISQTMDFFFYVSTFLVFASTFLCFLLVGYTNYNDFYKWILLVCSVLLGASLFASTFSIPASMMMSQTKGKGHSWYTSDLSLSSFVPRLRNKFQPICIFRMLMVIISSPICAYVISSVRTPVFEILDKQI